MSRVKLDLSEEERRKYNNKKHREQELRRKEKRTREAYKTIVRKVLETCEDLGWEKTDLVVGVEDDMIEAIVDKLIKQDCFGITLGSKMKVRVKNAV